jgi:hypothetical protein
MTEPPKSIITPERLVNLFSLFVVGTIAFIVLLVVPKALFPSWWPAIFAALLTITMLTYEVVVLSILIHYSTRGKEKFVNHFNTHKKTYYYYLIGVLAASIVVLAYFSNGNRYINALLYLVSLVFMILIIPLNKLLNKAYDRLFDRKEK